MKCKKVGKNLYEVQRPQSPPRRIVDSYVVVNDEPPMEYKSERVKSADAFEILIDIIPQD